MLFFFFDINGISNPFMPANLNELVRYAQILKIIFYADKLLIIFLFYGLG